MPTGIHILVDAEIYKNIIFLINIPIIGNVSELSGRSSDSENMRRVKATNTVIPSDIFSPLSGGNQNISNAIIERIKLGIAMYIKL